MTTAGEMNTFDILLDDYTNGFASTYTINFDTDIELATNDKLYITFPTGITPSTASTLVCATSAGLNSVTCAVSG